jgi:outer membrane protein OmpA-like peptidoglycan-associated protein
VIRPARSIPSILTHPFHYSHADSIYQQLYSIDAPDAEDHILGSTPTSTTPARNPVRGLNSSVKKEEEKEPAVPITTAERRLAFDKCRVNFNRKHRREDIHRPPKNWRTEQTPEPPREQQFCAHTNLYDHPLSTMRYPILMSLLELRPEILSIAKAKKRAQRQDTALGKITTTCLNQARNKQFVTTATKALDKWKDVQKQVDTALANCSFVEVNVLKQTMTLHTNIQFDGGGAEILAESASLMSEILHALKTLQASLKNMNEPMLHFSIEGHVQPTRDPERCMKISNDRAMRVATWLAKHGIPSEYLHCRGFGGTRPVSSDSKRSDENRRVEILLMSYREVQESYGGKKKKKPAVANAPPPRRRRQSMVDKQAAMFAAVRSLKQDQKDELYQVFMLFDKVSGFLV